MTTTNVPTTAAQPTGSQPFKFTRDGGAVLRRAVEAWAGRPHLHVTQMRCIADLALALAECDENSVSDAVSDVRHYLGETCAECGEETDETTGKRNYCSRRCYEEGGA